MSQRVRELIDGGLVPTFPETGPMTNQPTTGQGINTLRRAGAYPQTQQRRTRMTTQATPTSQHLAAAQTLLDELDEVIQRTDCNPQTKAVTAAAQSILVLAEQVAAIRVLMVGSAVSNQGNGQPAPQDKRNPKKRWW